VRLFDPDCYRYNVMRLKENPTVMPAAASSDGTIDTTGSASAPDAVECDAAAAPSVSSVSSALSVRDVRGGGGGENVGGGRVDAGGGTAEGMNDGYGRGKVATDDGSGLPDGELERELLAVRRTDAERAVADVAVSAAADLGKSVGDLQGKGLPPVGRNAPLLLPAMNRYDALRERYGGELRHLYDDRLRQGERRAAGHLQQNLLRQRGKLTLENHLQQRLLDAATTSKSVVNERGTSLFDSGVKRDAVLTDRGGRGGRGGGGGGAGRGGRGGVGGGNDRYSIADTDGRSVRGMWVVSADEAAQIIQTAIDLGNDAQLDYIGRLVGAKDHSRKGVSVRAQLLLNQGMKSGSAGHARTAQLLSAIIPSLRGKRVIDGILRRCYVGRRR
jgi:hypothetical protein